METGNAFSIKNAAKVILFLFLTISLFIIIISSISRFFLKRPAPVFLGILELSIYGIIVAVIYFFAKQGTLYPWQALGLRKAKSSTVFFSIITGIASILVASFLYGLFLKFFKLPEPHLEKAITKMFGSSLLGLIITFIIVVIAAPFAEELLFRGYLYQSFKNNWGKVWSIFVTSFLFALAHLSALILLPIYFFIGVVLALVREKNNSVIPSMVLHALNNFIFFLALVKLVK